MDDTPKRWLSDLLGEHWPFLLIVAVGTGIAAAYYYWPRGVQQVQRAVTASTPLQPPTTIKPTVETVDGHVHYTYEDVPDDFQPPSLAQLYTGSPVAVFIERNKPGALIQETANALKTFDWMPPSRPTNSIDYEWSNARKNLIELTEQHAMTLVCDYQESSGYQKELVFWFQTRPDKADPAFLKSLYPNNPAASIGPPRTDCPPTLSEAVAAGGFER
jgi:hypothetical protein